MTEWFVAKYMPDLRRREPRNVGVILNAGGRLHMRFYGERPDGTLDGRRVKAVMSLENYRDWVHYWRTLTSTEELPLVRRASDNYYVERGGQRLGGAEDSPEAMLASLYAQVVALPENPEREADPVTELFMSVGETGLVEPEPVIEIDLESYPFDYGIRTSERLLLFRRLVFNGSARKTWDSLHAAAEAVTQVAKHCSDKYAPYVIGFEKDPGDSVNRQIQAVERRLSERFRQSGGIDSDRAWLRALGAPIQVPVA